MRLDSVVPKDSKSVVGFEEDVAGVSWEEVWVVGI